MEPKMEPVFVRIWAALVRVKVSKTQPHGLVRLAGPTHDVRMETALAILYAAVSTDVWAAMFKIVVSTLALRVLTKTIPVQPPIAILNAPKT